MKNKKESHKVFLIISLFAIGISAYLFFYFPSMEVLSAPVPHACDASGSFSDRSETGSSTVPVVANNVKEAEDKAKENAKKDCLNKIGTVTSEPIGKKVDEECSKKGGDIYNGLRRICNRKSFEHLTTDSLFGCENIGNPTNSVKCVWKCGVEVTYTCKLTEVPVERVG